MKILLLQDIVFTYGSEKVVHPKGTILTATAFIHSYYVTSIGGIWEDEAQLIYE